MLHSDDAVATLQARSLLAEAYRLSKELGGPEDLNTLLAGACYANALYQDNFDLATAEEIQRDLCVIAY